MALTTTIHGQDTLEAVPSRRARARRQDRPSREALGIWRAISWREYGEKAKHAGLGLVALGLRPRDVVSVLADNCPEWLYTDSAP